MKKWFTSHVGLAYLESELNEKSKKGWLLFEIIPFANSWDGNSVVIVFYMEDQHVSK